MVEKTWKTCHVGNSSNTWWAWIISTWTINPPKMNFDLITTGKEWDTTHGLQPINHKTQKRTSNNQTLARVTTNQHLIKNLKNNKWKKQLWVICNEIKRGKQTYRKWERKKKFVRRPTLLHERDWENLGFEKIRGKMRLKTHKPDLVWTSYKLIRTRGETRLFVSWSRTYDGPQNKLSLDFSPWKKCLEVMEQYA